MTVKISWECDSKVISKTSLYKSTEEIDVENLPDPLFTSPSLVKEYLDEDIETFVKYYYLVSVETNDHFIYFSPKVDIIPKDYSNFLVVHLPFENSVTEDKGIENITWSIQNGSPVVIDDVDNIGNYIKTGSFRGGILKSNKNLTSLGVEDFTIQILTKPFKKITNSIWLWARYLAIGTNSNSGYLHIASNNYQETGRVHTESKVGWITDSVNNSYPDNVYKTISIVRKDGVFYQYSDDTLVGSNFNSRTYSIPSLPLFVGGNSVNREWINANIQDIKIYKGIAIFPDELQ